MVTQVLTGSKSEIAEKVASIPGDVREAIVFIEEALSSQDIGEDIFAEMSSFTVHSPRADDSREAIYQPVVNE